MIELNLLPDVKLQYVHAQKARRRVISVVTVGGIISVGLVVLFALYVYAVQPVRGLVVDAAIKDASTKLTGVPDLNNYLTLQQQLAALPGLHADKPIYSRIISYLPILNPSAPNSIRITRLNIDSTVDPNSIRITRLNIDSTVDPDTVVLDAYAPTYTAATVFESTLKSAQFTASNLTEPISLFSDVDLTNTALGQDADGNKVVTFTVTLKVSDGVFASDAANASISVPTQNATNSAHSVPGDIFAASGGN